MVLKWLEIEHAGTFIVGLKSTNVSVKCPLFWYGGMGINGFESSSQKLISWLDKKEAIILRAQAEETIGLWSCYFGVNKIITNASLYCMLHICSITSIEWHHTRYSPDIRWFFESLDILCILHTCTYDQMHK